MMRHVTITAVALLLAGCASSAPPQLPRIPQPRQSPQASQQPAHTPSTSQSSAAGQKQAQPTGSEAASTGSSQASSSRPPVDAELVERTRADRAAYERAEEDFRKRRADGSLADAEAADYAAYVAGLQRRVVEDCVALESSGAELPPDLPCETTVAGLSSEPLALDPQAVNTRAQRTETLDAQLRASLGKFDETLIREQDTVDAGAAAGASSGQGGQEGQGQQGAGGGQPGEQDGQAAGSGGSRSGRSREPGEHQGGLGSPGGRGAPAAREDGPGGSGDDVVARQLREAAERETDPELKEKLWEEYRKYKQGTS